MDARVGNMKFISRVEQHISLVSFAHLCDKFHICAHPIVLFSI